MKSKHSEKKTFYFEKLILSVMYISLVLILLLSYSNNSAWMYDALAMIVAIGALNITYKKLHINHMIMSFCFISIMLHMLGIYGFYSSAPLGLRYDHYVHFFGGMTVCMIAYNYLERYHANKRYANIHRPAVILLSVCIAMGLGSMVEMTEYVGWYIYGEGEGLFMLGAGDLSGNSTQPGEWINASLDMIFNAFGAIIGALAMSINIRRLHKSEHKADKREKQHY